MRFISVPLGLSKSLTQSGLPAIPTSVCQPNRLAYILYEEGPAVKSDRAFHQALLCVFEVRVSWIATLRNERYRSNQQNPSLETQNKSIYPLVENL